jgi:hypothetical protein
MHTYCGYTIYIQYTYSHREGGMRELNQREGERSNTGEYRSQNWFKITTEYI